MNVNPLELIPRLDAEIEWLRGDRPFIRMMSFLLGMLAGGGIVTYISYIEKVMR